MTPVSSYVPDRQIFLSTVSSSGHVTHVITAAGSGVYLFTVNVDWQSGGGVTVTSTGTGLSQIEAITPPPSFGFGTFNVSGSVVLVVGETITFSVFGSGSGRPSDIAILVWN